MEKLLKLVSLVCVCLMLLSCMACGTAGQSDSTTTSTTLFSEADVTTTETAETTVSTKKTNTTTETDSSTTTETDSSTTTTTSATVTTQATQQSTEEYDKPVDYKIVYTAEPVKSTVDKEANAMRDKVMNATCAAPPSTGTKWYISNKGNDNNDGKSPETALATTQPLKYRLNPQAGDSILFECGGVYYGVSITASSDMFIGSYGSGEKPCLYAATENSAKATWARSKNDNNIWRLNTVQTSGDVGVIVFDHGEKWGSRKFSGADLKEDLDFYFDGTYVYVYYTKDLIKDFKSIIVTPKSPIITIKGKTSNVTIDNLTLKYSGSFAISAEEVTGKGTTVRNCEIAWIGGILYGSSGTTRYGNGIEWWNGCEDALVENCWVYQIYDSGISPQGNSDHVEKNITIRNNLIEYCGYASYEYWVHPAPKASIENMLVTGNIMRFAGCGFGTDGRDNQAPHIRSNSGLDNLCTSFEISNNILEGIGKGNLFYCESLQNTLPVFKGNRYIQVLGGKFGFYGQGSVKVQDEAYVQKYMTEVLGDTTGKFEVYP